jgi:hypothetical protein
MSIFKFDNNFLFVIEKGGDKIGNVIEKVSNVKGAGGKKSNFKIDSKIDAGDGL